MSDSPPAMRLRWTFGSGAAVGAAFGRAFALISLVAWASLAAQVHLLIGNRGLLPIGELMESVRAEGGVSFFRFPTLFLWTQSDAALTVGVAAGLALSLGAFVAGDRGRRLCFALSLALYLSFAIACRLFLAFQWDNLLLECSLLAAFLPTGRPAPLVHFLFRVVLFKLYFESGIAKWQSPLHDWHDGSAMTVYYETAPLPTVLGFYAHNLPVWWHHFESRATLALELVLPLAIFGPRRARLFTAAVFAAFQVVNAATANYGFFCYLALALNFFLLDDADVLRARGWVAARLPEVVRRRWARAKPAHAPHSPPAPVHVAARWAGRAGAAVFVLVSLVEGLFTFTEPGPILIAFTPVIEVNRAFRLVNTYHLFAAVTRERIEPSFETLDEPPSAGDIGRDGAPWVEHALHHKPGDVRRAPDFVAPHQPRVDFQLWFYGLSFQRRQPVYVSTLVERMCEDPPAVQALFRNQLPPRPRAVRLVYWQYHFTRPAEVRASGAWWRRARAAVSPAVPCPVAGHP